MLIDLKAWSTGIYQGVTPIEGRIWSNSSNDKFWIFLESNSTCPPAWKEKNDKKFESHLLVVLQLNSTSPPDWMGTYAPVAWLVIGILPHRISLFNLGLNYFPQDDRSPLLLRKFILSKEAEVERNLHTRLKRKHSEHRNRLWKFNMAFGWGDEQLSNSPSTASGPLHWFRCIHWPVPWFRVGSAKRVSDDMIASNLFVLLSILCGEIKSKWMNTRRGVETFATVSSLWISPESEREALT